MKTFASLSKKQIVLYRDLVDDLKDFLDHSEGIQRRGLILSSLMKCKQLCNHPDQFLGTGGIRGTAQRQIPTPPGTLRDGPGETRKNARVHAIQGNHRALCTTSWPASLGVTAWSCMAVYR